MVCRRIECLTLPYGCLKIYNACVLAYITSRLQDTLYDPQSTHKLVFSF